MQFKTAHTLFPSSLSQFCLLVHLKKAIFTTLSSHYTPSSLMYGTWTMHTSGRAVVHVEKVIRASTTQYIGSRIQIQNRPIHRNYYSAPIFQVILSFFGMRLDFQKCQQEEVLAERKKGSKVWPQFTKKDDNTSTCNICTKLIFK